ncbi:MAG: diadenylate cyclase [bacterium]|nr:diadenylate cyclase [bacterium]MDO5462939.1 diadenylate cyclase [bacterium]
MFSLWWPNLLDLLQIYLLTVGIYWILKFLRGTRAAQMLLGIGTIFVSLFLVTALLDLDVLGEILQWVSLFLLLALLVVFHPEIRRALSLIGRNTTIQILQGRLPETPAERVVRIARALALRRVGALIALERTVQLDHWVESGVLLDAKLSEELLISIFTPPLPLHDGGVVLRGDRVIAAHCIFPIDNEVALLGLGTRHRAAVSLSAECDAVVLVVSEERGQISVAREGALLQNLSDRQLERIIRATFVPEHQQRNFFPMVFGSKYRLPWYLRPLEIFRKRTSTEGDEA